MRSNSPATVGLAVTLFNLSAALYCQAMGNGRVEVVIGEFDALSGSREVESISRDSFFNRFVLKRI
ncbi:hypothetical protein DV711_12610 [Motiliproteus coralliicola]|uniref:Uncharacterized protein n=1 Tax=Motiliproteus coralliicola TaxID=2283196 RepID=A0A369WJT8_9GAMM|nr:hypothetical protein DV711_12610 [Motiliproteus coralliicola]